MVVYIIRNIVPNERVRKYMSILKTYVLCYGNFPMSTADFNPFSDVDLHVCTHMF